MIIGNGGGNGFGYSANGNATASATFYRCRAGNSGSVANGGFCFGVADGAVGDALFSGKAYDCATGYAAFGVANGGAATFSGDAEDCRLSHATSGGGFGATPVASAGAVTCSGKLRNCRVDGSGGGAFGASLGSGTVLLSALEARGCVARGKAFGYSASGDVSMTNTQLKDCRSDTYSYGSVFGGAGGVSIDSTVEMRNCEMGRNQSGQAGLGFGFAGGSGNVFIGGRFSYCHGGGADMYCSQSFGAAYEGQVELNQAVFDHCLAGAGSFGCSVSPVGNGVTISGATFEHCKGVDTSFGSAPVAGGGAVSVTGTFSDCDAGEQSFGYAATGDVSVMGEFRRCTAYQQSFGCAVAGAGTCLGTFEDCTAARYSFGAQQDFGARAVRCRALEGGCFGALATSTCTLIDCAVEGITALLPGPTLAGGSLVRGSRFEATDVAASPLWLSGDDTRLYNCEFISAGAAAVDAAVATRVSMAHCRMNVGVGANVTNSVGSPLNVVDPAVL